MKSYKKETIHERADKRKEKDKIRRKSTENEGKEICTENKSLKRKKKKKLILEVVRMKLTDEK